MNFAQALGLPQGHKCFGAVMLGYPPIQVYHEYLNANAPVVTWRVKEDSPDL